MGTGYAHNYSSVCFMQSLLPCVVCLSVLTRYKWGSVTHQSVGVVRSINRNGTDVCVDFSEQNNWTGLISEMEVVPGIHPRQRFVFCYPMH